MNRKVILSTTILLFTMILWFLSSCNTTKKVMESDKQTSPIVFRLADTMDSNHPSAMAAEHFASLVKKKSEGRIKIKVYYEGELGTPEEILEQVQFGGIAMARVNVLDLAEAVPSLQQHFKPQAYGNSDDLMQWIEENTEQLSDSCQMERLIPLVWYYPDIRCFYSDEESFHKVSDLKNMKIKTTLGAIMQETMAALGCTAVETVTADTYKSLRSGYMDAGETALSEFVLSDYYRFINYITLSQYMSCPDVIVVSSIDFSLLEISDRELLQQCAKETYGYQKILMEKSRATWVKELKKNKELFIEDDAFKKDMEKVFSEEKEEY